MTNTHNLHEKDKWESGELGRSAKHIRKVSLKREQAIDDALGLQVISMRLQKELIKELKSLAVEQGIGYQVLARQILTNFVRNNLRKHGRLRTAG